MKLFFYRIWEDFIREVRALLTTLDVIQVVEKGNVENVEFCPTIGTKALSAHPLRRLQPLVVLVRGETSHQTAKAPHRSTLTCRLSEQIHNCQKIKRLNKKTQKIVKKLYRGPDFLCNCTCAAFHLTIVKNFRVTANL